MIHNLATSRGLKFTHAALKQAIVVVKVGVSIQRVVFMYDGNRFRFETKIITRRALPLRVIKVIHKQVALDFIPVAIKDLVKD